MARVPPLQPGEIEGSLRSLYERFTQPHRDFTNQANILAHSPASFRHLYGLVEALAAEGTLPNRLIEIAVVTASRINECQYCINHHGSELVRLGLPEKTVESILNAHPDGLNDQEIVVRDYARLVSESAWRIPGSLFVKMKKYFNDREIVELTVRIGLCILFNKFNQSLQIEHEDSPLSKNESPDVLE